MTQLRLDEMLSPKIAEALRSAGVDVVSVSAEPNFRGLADSDVLDWAASEGRVLVTDNIKDFAVLNAQWAASPRKHPGLLFISAKAFPPDRGRIGRVVTALLHRNVTRHWPVRFVVARRAGLWTYLVGG